MDEPSQQAIQKAALQKLAEEFQDKVLLYEPPLAQTLGQYERGEGRPLTKEEVLYLRDKEFCRFVSREEARQIEEARGYADVDYENVWESWQRLCAEMERLSDD